MITRVVLLWLLCCTLPATAAQLFPFGSTWRLRKGTAEASTPDTTAWRGAAFNDASFVDAAAPFWYGDTRTGGTQLTDMLNTYTCVFLRKSFNASDLSQIGGLRLTYFIDDGFIVWLNGVEIYRENVSDPNPTISTLAANQPTDPAVTTSVNIVPPAGSLLNGANLIAVQFFNTAIGSTDIGFDLALDTIIAETIPPTIGSKLPAPGTVTALTGITLTFSEPVTGVDAGDMLLNGIPVDGVSGSGTTYTFSFAQPPYGEVFITWSAGNNIVDEATPPNPFHPTGPGATWQYTLIDQTPPVTTLVFPAPGSALRSLSQIEVTFSEEVAGVDAADLRINGQPATSVTRNPGGPYVFQFPPASAGSVQIQWAAGHGITDQAVPANPFGGSSWSYTVDPNLATANLVINEILASNQNGLQDEDLQPEDWIEIYNAGTSTVDLTGWSLSDDPELPGLWTFGSRALGPGQHLVVFASGKDRKNPTGANRFHTNFQLSEGGEFLGLYNTDSPRVLVSTLGAEYPEQRNDFSYGYDPQKNLRYFSTPTPGAPNGSSTITSLCEPVHFSMARGFFTQPFDVVLTTPTPGANIRYTLDGTVPTAVNGQIYVGPLRVTNTTYLRAAAFRPNTLPSTVNTHTYFFNQSAATRSLPVLSIVTATSNLYGRTGILGMNGGTRSGDGAFIVVNPLTDYHNPSQHGIAWERPVSAELINPADNSGFQIDCGIRVQGSDWQRPRTLPTTKFSYRLYFRGDYGVGRLEYPVFPLTTVQNFDQLVLRAGYNEANNPFVRDELGRRLFADMGNVSSLGRFYNLFTNGVFAGFYNPCERVHEEFGQAHHGGSSDWDIIAPSFATSSEGLGVVDGDRNDFTSLHNYINGQTATTITNPAVYLEINRRLDLKNFVDYCLLNAHAAMGDWPANNWRAGKDRAPGGIWRFYVWDAEWGFGFGSRGFTRDSFAEAGGGPSDSGLNSVGASEIARMYQKMRPSREFRLLWADRVYKHYFNNGTLSDLHITNRLIEMRNEFSTIFAMNMGELGPFLANRRGVMMGFLNNYGLFGVSNSLYGFYATSNAPALNQHGGKVAPGFGLTMTAPLGGTIYYTTNGSDPRVPFSGAVSNAAVVYTEPVVLNRSLPVKARTLLNGTNWSALADVTFEVGTFGVPLRITEIMYNPPGGSIHEFIELQNFGGNIIDLSEFNFTEGITFTFLSGTTIAPGARIVLANNTDPAAFATRYPGIAVTGYFNGNLNNGGERVTLVDRTGNIVASVDFRDTGGWPTGADGLGASLELVDLFGDPDAPANWRASQSVGGTPGTANAVPATPPVRLHEVLAVNTGAVNNGGTFPGYVELFNPGGGAFNVGGWSLTDDGNSRKFVFAAGTQVPAGGYLVVWLDAVTNTSPGLHAGFSLGPKGGNVLLYNAAGELADAVSLGLQVANLSVGRLTGNWVLNQTTPNADNVPAATGSASGLRINEWLANPPAGQDDWLEIYNPAAQPVSLQGMFLTSGSGVHRISLPSFVAPGGFVQLFADEGTGVDHLDFRLTAAGATVTLLDATATQIDSISYTAALEGVSRGRLPDGSVTVTNFPGSASPAAANYLNTYTGPVLNEVLARNRSITNSGRVADFIELYNPGGAGFDLGGMSLGVNAAQAGQWIFPPGTIVPAGGYLLVWCDDTQPPSTLPGNFNTGEALDGESGGAYLFNSGGQLVDSVEYGFQVANLSIGRVSNQWRLLATPTPAQVNSATATVGNAGLVRINEWMADPATGPDWFELYNTGTSPVDLTGLLLTDDGSSAGLVQFRIAPLSFIGAGGFVQWIADGNPGEGRNHLNFSLDAGGESLLLLATNGTAFTLLDGITFAAQQRGVSEGRLPDGTNSFALFGGSATPADSNYRLAPVVINEILTHTDAPLEDAVEIYNPGTQAVDISGWYLSNSRENLKKYRIQGPAAVPAGGYLVFTQAQFGNNGANSFSFSSAHGDEAWLSAADGAGNLTGLRAGARFGAAANGVSFGRIVTSVGVDYAALASRSLPGVNGAPLLGPVTINEVYYNPATNGEEFVEIRNTTAGSVPLFDPAFPTNTWRVAGGIGFTFPQNTTLAAGGYALVVDFNPADVIALGIFRTRFSVPSSVPVFGPFTGRLNNDGDSVELLRPDSPQGAGPEFGFVPYLRVDRLEYDDEAPWPAGAVDGGGYSLQRRSPLGYGNDPVQWVGGPPTAGGLNSTGAVAPPTVVTSPQNITAFEGQAFSLTVSASGGPLTYQWRFNGVPVPDATNSTFGFDYPVLENDGLYDVIVSNPGGSAVSGSGRVIIRVPPMVIAGPVSLATFPGSNVVFTVVARGSAPLLYQWRQNGVDLPGRTNASLSLTNVQIIHDGQYDVVISNASGSAVATARLDILVRPVITVHPASQSVPPGSIITLSVEATGNPLPFTFEWRRGSLSLKTNVAHRRFDFFTVAVTNLLPNPNPETYRAVVKNQANLNPGTPSSFANITIVADGDADGLPDAWETQYEPVPGSGMDRNADSDQDGLTNGEEYLAGTEPNNPASYLRVDLGVIPNVATISFNAVAAKTYSILYTDDLGSGSWSTLRSIIALSNNRVESVEDPDWKPARYYKLVTPAQ